jgi:competence protein ComGC
MKAFYPLRPNRGFSLIEAIIMIVVLIIFSMLLYGVIKKDFLQNKPVPQAEQLPSPVAPPSKP